MRRTLKLMPIILVAVALCAGYWVWHSRRAAQRINLIAPVLRVAFLNADLGGGVLLKTPDGEFCLIDPGPASAERKLRRYLQNREVTSVTVVLTNPSPERSGALNALIEPFRIKRIIRGEIGDGWTGTSRYARAKSVPELVLSAGDGIGLSRKVRLEVLSPPKGLIPGISPGAASNSLVTRIRFGRKTILLASDAGIEAESWLIRSKADLSADVLAVGQRGKRGASSLEFISFVRPRVFVVSAGGRLGRPSRTVLARIAPEHTGAAVYRTDRDGTVELVTDGRNLAVETKQVDRE